MTFPSPDSSPVDMKFFTTVEAKNLSNDKSFQSYMAFCRWSPEVILKEQT